jgi:hypothetical protein
MRTMKGFLDTNKRRWYYMCIHLSLLKWIYIITISLFILVFISDFIEINFRHLRNKRKWKVII